MVNKFVLEYKKSFKYLKDSKNYIFVIIGIFVLFGIIGFFVPASEYIYSQILNYISQLLEKTEGFGFGDMFFFIFFNNFKSSFFGLFGGIFFGIFSLFTSLANGYVIGFVSQFTTSQQGASILWRLVPHGIFELPAVFISLGMGVKLGSFFLKKNKLNFIKENLRSSLGVFVTIVLPLLLIAAIIESVLIIFT